MSIFKSKEQYLNFKKAWAESVNSPEAKSTFEITAVIKNQVKWYGRNAKTWVEHTTKIKRRGNGRNLGFHHVLYNLFRGKPADFGFTKVTNPAKLKNNYPTISVGFSFAVFQIRSLLICIKEYRKYKNAAWNEELYKKHCIPNYAKPESKEDFELRNKKWCEEELNKINDYLKFFKGTVTMEMVEKIHVSIEKQGDYKIWIEGGTKNV